MKTFDYWIHEILFIPLSILILLLLGAFMGLVAIIVDALDGVRELLSGVVLHNE